MRPIFNEKLLKSEVCGPVGPTDVLKMAEKSKFLATVHAQYMNSSLCLPLRMQKKKKKKRKTQTLNPPDPNAHIVALLQIQSAIIIKFFIYIEFTILDVRVNYSRFTYFFLIWQRVYFKIILFFLMN